MLNLFSVIEDTAVHPELLPDFIHDLDKVLEEMDLDCVYYAHIATGELHLRPVLNLKLQKDVERFRKIADETARLVKKYKGSLSGEHGDGRLRGEFIPFMIGEENYKLIKDLKKVWDPNGILNPGKIVDTPPMDKFLRYEPDKPTLKIDTVFDFGSQDRISASGWRNVMVQVIVVNGKIWWRDVPFLHGNLG